MDRRGNSSAICYSQCKYLPKESSQKNWGTRSTSNTLQGKNNEETREKENVGREKGYPRKGQKKRKANYLKTPLRQHFILHVMPRLTRISTAGGIPRECGEGAKTSCSGGRRDHILLLCKELEALRTMRGTRKKKGLGG